MKRTISYFFLVLFILVVSCAKEVAEISEEIVPNQASFYFQDDFEVESNVFEELFPQNGTRWSGVQQVDTESGQNEIELSNGLSSLGSNSLFMHSKSTIETLSKIDIEKNGFQALQGSILRFEADYYIDSNANFENLFLFDLECCSCWDPDVPENQCPGIRLKLGGNNEYLSIERGKIGLETVGQTEYSFPKKQWVNVVLEMTLSNENDGQNKLLINGIEVINENFSNLPNQAVFTALFQNEGIDFQLQEPLFYERFQIGATANSSSNDLDLYIDNVKLSIE